MSMILYHVAHACLRSLMLRVTCLSKGELLRCTTDLQESCIERVYVCGRQLYFAASGGPLPMAVTEAEA